MEYVAICHHNTLMFTNRGLWTRGSVKGTAGVHNSIPKVFTNTSMVLLTQVHLENGR